MKTLGFAWAGVYVEDMESSIAFYRDVLGLPLLGQGDDGQGNSYAHFRAGEGALLELSSGGHASHSPKGPERQSTIISFRVESLDGAMLELAQKGVAFTGEIGKYKNSRWAYFSDPEGNRLEIKEAPPAYRKETS